MRRPALQSLRLSKPTQVLVSLADLKKHLEVEHGEDDGLITGLGAAAYEHLTGIDTLWQRVWLQERWRDYWPDFSRRPLLRMAPVIGLFRVTYINTAGTEMLIKPEACRTMREAAGVRVVFNQGFELPTDVADRDDAVRIDYEAGYGPEPDDVPAPVKHAVKLLVGHWYRNRDEVIVSQASPKSIPLGVTALMMPFRRIGVEAWDNPPEPTASGTGVTAVQGTAITQD